MKGKSLEYYFSILFYWFLFFTTISLGFYVFLFIVPANDLEGLIVRNRVGRWLIINIILTFITGGYKLYKNSN